MPVHNAAPYLHEAMKSILNQSFTDFNFCVMDDGSTDESWSILNAYKDSRIHLLRNESNEGWIKSLSKLLRLAKGRYVARQDADDISSPDRLAEQIAFMEANPQVVLCGSAYTLINAQGKEIETVRPPVEDTLIRWQMLFHNSFAHTSVMFRSETLHTHQLHYDENVRHAEDYKLWSELMRYGAGINLNRPLVKYRIHPNQMVEVFSAEKDAAADRISQSNLKRIGLRLSLEEVADLRQHYHYVPSDGSKESIKVAGTFLQILDAFSQQSGLNGQILRNLRRKYIQQALSTISFRSIPPWNAYGVMLKAFQCGPAMTISQLMKRTGRILSRP